MSSEKSGPNAQEDFRTIGTSYLENYGQHHGWCVVAPNRPESMAWPVGVTECNCGYEDALRHMRGEPVENPLGLLDNPMDYLSADDLREMHAALDRIAAVRRRAFTEHQNDPVGGG